MSWSPEQQRHQRAGGTAQAALGGAVDHREHGDSAAVQDAEWRSRVRESARADVRAMVRASRRRKAERWLVTATVLVAIVAVLMLLVGVGMFDERDRSAARPTQDQGQKLVQVVDLDAPFAGTPAEGWADGAEGITAPAPMQVGEFSADEVAAATGLVRDALVASRIDRTMLIDHDPDAYLRLLAPDARKLLKPLFGTGREPQAQALVSLIAQGNPLLDVEPKVKGTMTVEAGAPTSIACDWYKKGFLAPAARDQSATHVQRPGHDRASFFDPKAELPAESGCPS